jgi:hypothetical protein
MSKCLENSDKNNLIPFGLDLASKFEVVIEKKWKNFLAFFDIFACSHIFLF